MKLLRIFIPLSLFIAVYSASSLKTSAKDNPPQEILIQEVALEINGTKIWFPGNITAKKGDKIKIHAVSKIGGKNNIHGFAIKQFNVEALVDDKGKDIEFVADKAGIFPIYCHLHPAHVGGQLVVLE